MYYIIRDSGVETYKTIKEMTKKSDVVVQQEDFKSIGADFIVYLNASDIAFCQDAKKLSTLALNKLFRQDNLPRMILYVMLVLQVFTFLKG